MKILFFVFFILFFGVSYGQDNDLYDYNNTVSRLKDVGKPVITEDYIIFTQKTGPRFIGIVFDFEGYSEIHKFMNHTNRDLEGEVTSSLMFYILKRPAPLTSITYRLIIDGLWTHDPLNPDTLYDDRNGITLSHLDLGSPLELITNNEVTDTVKFIYNGKPGITVRLGGSFTSWDSWIYVLKETKPGFYELDLPLPQGTYYYNYYLGMKAITDKTNPHRAWTEDGRIASVIEVK